MGHPCHNRHGGVGKLTQRGERFLSEPAILQAWLLMTTWWIKVNWATAISYLDDEHLPHSYSRIALEQLLDLPIGSLVSFEPFADRMIKKSRMFWDSPDNDNSRRTLHSVIERTLINPLADFGALQKEYAPHELLGGEFQQLSSFQITPFGRGLLEAINGALKQDS